ncbi:MAG: DNA translocase FtsK [bacterium]|nr:DNA translocase FtsK [bacterium]
MLDEPAAVDTAALQESVQEATRKLKETFRQFDIDADVVHAIVGPVITCYEVQPAPGVKVSKITSLENDIALAMKAKSIRIVAPIPGRDAVGIELPNEVRRIVRFSELMLSPEYAAAVKKMTLPLALGQTLSGDTFVDDLADMPHLLVAGATGSGKSVCINTILLSLLFRFEPHELRLVLVDPKHVELVPYHQLPHLLTPVLNDPAKVPEVLDWLISEMDKRYKYFGRLGVRNIGMFNKKRLEDRRPLKISVGSTEHDLPSYLPYVVVVIDELADLMLVAAEEIERKIIRLAQLARAAGIHLVLATQRPSTNVITGLIKANIPARVAFRTTSNIDSRVIIDEPGSEKLLGKGDMLYKAPSVSRTLRIQGAFVSEDEVKRVTDMIRDQRPPQYVDLNESKDNMLNGELEMDEKFDEAVRATIESGQASASYLQRRLQIGYARAARLVDLMEAHGIIGPKRGAKPREILVDQWPPPSA